MSPLEILEWIKFNWKEIVQFGSLLATILIVLFLKRFIKLIKQGIANLFTWDGFVLFIIVSIYMLRLLISFGII